MIHLFITGLLGIAFLAAPAAQADPPTRLSGANTPDVDGKETEKPKLDEVLHLAPTDAFLVFYVHDIARAGQWPFWSLMQEPGAHMSALCHALQDTFEGPLLLAVSGTPINPISWQIRLAGRTRLAEDEFFARMAAEVPVRFNSRFDTPPVLPMSFLAMGNQGTWMIPTPMGFPVSLGVAWREGMVLAGSNLATVQSWRSGGSPGEAFVDQAAGMAMLAGFEPGPEIMLHFDLRTVVPMVLPQLDDIVPGLSRALQVDRIESLSLLLPGERAKAPCRIAIGLDTRAGPGTWRLLASTPTASKLSAWFPPGRTIFFHGGWNAANALTDFLAMLAPIAQEIVDEFHEERAQFASEVGFDPVDDFFALLADEWAMGGIVGRNGVHEPLLALRLKDPPTFQLRIEQLRNVFELTTTLSRHRDVTIYHAQRALGPLSYAIHEDVLLISQEPQAVADGLSARIENRNLNTDTRFASARNPLAERTAKLVYLDPHVITRTLQAEGDEIDEVTQAMLHEFQGPLALAVVPHERVVTIDLTVSAARGGTGAAILRVAASLVESHRRQTQRTLVLNTLRQAVIACLIWGNDHKGQWPASLSEVIEAGHVTPAMLRDPAATVIPESGFDSSYSWLIYRQPPAPGTFAPAHHPVICEARVRNGGVGVAFADGHVEWLPSPMAEQMIARMKSGQ